MNIGVIDYGVGNVGSLISSLNELQINPITICQAANINTVDKLILPGVGNFSDCIKILNEDGWSQALSEYTQINNKSLLGICLGMQLLATRSSEGSLGGIKNGALGLNLIPGYVENLRNLGCNLRTPHVGWNNVKICNESDELFKSIQNNSDFYFVHSYAFLPDNLSHIIATTDYDISITAAVRYKNIWGTQFHPEKSSKIGLQLLQNFIES
ncbi:HisH Glutamine amidotransferase [Methylophilaceae bacterium]